MGEDRQPIGLLGNPLSSRRDEGGRWDLDWRPQTYPEGQSGQALQAVCGKGDVVDAMAGGRV